MCSKASPPTPLQKRDKASPPYPSPKERGVIRLEGVEKEKEPLKGKKGFMG